MLCFECHDEITAQPAEWPEERQLALLKRSRPKDYSLATYNKIKGFGPMRIVTADVDEWLGD